MKSAAIIAAIIALGCFFCGIEQAHAQIDQQSLQVRYAGAAAEPYAVHIQSGGKYSISQSYSWVRDETSRYSLVSYSIDDGPTVDITRKSRGTFLLEVPAESARTVTFQSAVQYPLSGTTDSENLVLTFAPSSPTGDNWFDSGSAITVTVSNRDQIAGVRQQIASWSLDNSRRDIESPVSNFTTPAIQLAAAHQVKFASIAQYYLDIVSLHGSATGEGWYDAGTLASVSIQNDDDLLLGQRFGGWQDSTGNILEGNFQSIVVDSPVTLTAKWTADYGTILLFVTLPIAGVVVVVIMKKSRHAKRLRPESIVNSNQSNSQFSGDVPLVTVRTTKLEDSDSQISSNSYSKEITAYSLQKSVEKLHVLKSSGLVSDAKLPKIVERLEDGLE